jgi:NADH dehydrogenase [ubiquinone] 1 alpha subcomplex assembly factor 7
MGGFRRLARAALAAAARGGAHGGAASAGPSRAPTLAPAVRATRRSAPLAAREFASASRGDEGDGASTSGAPIAHGWGAEGEDSTDPDGSARRALEVAIDRTGLFRAIEQAHGGDDATKHLRGLEAHLASIIKFRGGPVTVAEYMQEVLTHPEFGYYMHRDVFGQRGDFITSPEVSQVFGELMGAWAVWQWTQLGKPKNVKLIELGPGRGTLMADLLRATSVFKEFTQSVSVHMVEVSPALREMQRKSLRCGETFNRRARGDAREAEAERNRFASLRVPKNPLNVVESDGVRGAIDEIEAPSSGAHGSTPEELGLEPVDEGVSEFGGVPVAWHETLDGVPNGPTILVAHEFFDAMPVHQFTRTERGWCERLVAIRGSVSTQGEGDEGDESDVSQGNPSDAAEDGDGEKKRPALEMVLSPGLTPAGALMIPRRLEGMPEDVKGGLRQLEISPRTLAIWERVAARVERHGGAAIAVDYGEEGPIGDSLQAIKDHAFVPVLQDPGSADLSVYVDFGAMRQVIERRGREPGGGGTGKDEPSGVRCYGPVTQRDLLFKLGIQERLQTLVGECETEEQAERVYDACARLVGGDELRDDSAGTGPGMGFRYKALAIVSAGLGAPAGFE